MLSETGRSKRGTPLTSMSIVPLTCPELALGLGQKV